jgi:hypothetical protein
VGLALVPVRRPADAVFTLGWNDTEFDTAGEISVILRSWEDRLGAYIVSLAPGGMDLTIERPPQTTDDQWKWAVEQLAFNKSGALMFDGPAGLVRIQAKFEDVVGFYWD